MRVLYIDWQMFHYRAAVLTSLAALPGLELFGATGGVDRVGQVQSASVKMFEQHFELKGTRLGSTFLWLAGCFGVVRMIRPDVVLINSNVALVSNWLLLPWLRLRGVRVVAWTHGWRSPDKGAKRYARLLYYNFANRLLIYGERSVEFGALMGYPRNRMTLVRNSMSEGSCERALFRTRRLAEPTIGVVCRVQPRKQLEMLAEIALAAGSDLGTEISVSICGPVDPRYSAVLKAVFESKGVELNLVGALYGDELESFYSGVHVSVVPSMIGLTAVQSLLYGVPVVTHSVYESQGPEVESVLSGVNGSLVPKGDVTEFGRAAAYWISRSISDDGTFEKACKSTVDPEWCASSHARRIARGLGVEI